MDGCVICLAVANDPSSCIFVDSNEWQTCNIKRIIEKHLWWWHLKQSSSIECSYICRQCWNVLSSFHTFYLEVEKLHQQYDVEKWPILKDSIVVKEKSDLKENLNERQEAQEKSPIVSYKICISDNNETFELLPRSENNEINNYTDNDCNKSKGEAKRQYDEYLAQIDHQLFCNICIITLKSFRELKYHYRVEHNMSGYAMCCNRKFYNRGQFTDHLKVHENPNYFKCSFCSRILCHRSSYVNHLKRHKRSTKRMLVCKVCQKSFYKKRDYNQHKKNCKRKSKSLSKYQNNSNTISNDVEKRVDIPSDANSGSMIRFENDDQQVESSNLISSEGVSSNYEPFSNALQNNFIVSQNTEINECHSIIKSEKVNYSENVEEIHSDDNAYATQFEPYSNTGWNNYINDSQVTENIICSENGEIFNYTFIEESSNFANTDEPISCKSSIKLWQQDERLKKSNKIKQKYKNVQIKKQTKNANKERFSMDEEYLKYSKYEISCHLCMTSFTSFWDLKSHFRLQHNVNGYAICCNKKLYNRGQFADHLRVHKNPNYFKCAICSKVLCHRTSYENHLDTHKSKQNDPDLISVQQFDKTYRYRRKDKTQSNEMQQEQTCPFCSKVSSNVQAHREHIRNTHIEERKHVCHICDKRFKRPFNLREHISTHTGVPLHFCPHCSRSFNSAGNMHTHRKRIHRKEWLEARIRRQATQKLKKISDGSETSAET